MSMNSGIINIRGKQYQTVPYRLQEFRKQYPIESGWSIETDIIEASTEFVIFKATIKNGTAIVATGHAEECRDSSHINKTSALENAETSAIGRALASAGFVGSAFSSAEEVQAAQHQQQHKRKYTPAPTRPNPMPSAKTPPQDRDWTAPRS